jgi:hypothetical protein
MGYRSQVGYAIQFDKNIQWTAIATDADKELTGEDIFNTFLTEAKAKTETMLCFDEENSPLEIDKEKLLFKFYVDDWKWYESYSGVSCHESLLSLADEYIEAQENNQAIKNLTISYGFVRIGEETNDIDERYGGDDGFSLLYSVRSIEFEC